ncbi:hypothetical protein N6H14_21575 [Paenibacillus sp. CC-CFT747]|nr:hypothetical protein N6H14_21575 [Paenibacillus sp. CC-CFT747]
MGLLNAYYTESQVGDTVFLFSKDGIHWDKRYAGYKPDSFLPLGEEDEWDSGFLFSVQEPVPVGDRIYFYYQAMNRPHNWIAWFENERDFLGRLSAQRQWEAKLGQRKVYEKEVIKALYEELAARVEKRQQSEQAQFIRGMGLATLREDGFVSLTGRKEKPGLVITKPFPLGEKLFVNADCRAGTLTASLTDEAGNPLEGGEACHLSGQDGTRLELPWSSLRGAERAGRNVKLHLTLQDCHLYSVVF